MTTAPFPSRHPCRHLPALACALALLLPAPGAAGASIPATVVVNTTETYQTIDGFGASIVTYDRLADYQDPAFYDRAVFDFGLTILRLPMGGLETNDNDNTDATDFNLAAVDRDAMAYPMEIARQFRARGVSRIMATPWSPPGWMKTNRFELLGGRLRPDRREEFAEYLSGYIRAARELYDVRIDAVSLQNELLFVEPYGSCVYNPLQLRETLRAVLRHFAANGVEAEIVLPEEMGSADRVPLYVEPLMVDGETRGFPGVIASHGANGFRNWRRLAAQLAPYGKRFWMTETSGHTPDWKGGLALAENMHDTLAGGNASAFIYWQFTAPEPDRMSLMAHSDYTPKAAAAKHFTRYVRPGAQRVHAGGRTAGLLVSAYKHPGSGDIAIVAINPGITDVTANLEVADARPPAGWLTFTSREGRFHQPGRIGPGEALTVPARGIITLYGRCGENLAALPSLVPPGWQPPPPSAPTRETKAVEQRLHSAARGNDVALVRQLLAEGLDPNALNIGKLSPLHRAAWPGNVDVVRPLLDGGANVNLRDGSGGTPLMIGASNGHEAFVEALVTAGADLNLADDQGMVPIHRAALGGHTATVRLLLRLGANPNLADNHGWSALHWAAAGPGRSSVETLRVLVDAGTKVTADAEGMTPLHVAAANLIDPFFALGRRQGPEVLYLNAQRLRVLVEAGADVNAADARGRTALHWAAWVGETYHGEDAGRRPFFQYRIEAVRYLLAAGGRADVKDAAGRVPADYAETEGYFEAAGLLRNASSASWLVGAPPKPEPKEISAAAAPAPERPAPGAGRGGLARAAANGDVAGIRAALAAGADPNGGGPMGGPPLTAAVVGGHLEAIKLLLAAGADPTQRDSDGYTALDRALQNNQGEIVTILQAAMDADPGLR